MESNPYESPVFTNEPAPVPADAPVKVFDLAKARRMVRIPALLMMATAIMAIPIDIVLFCQSVFYDMPKFVVDFYTIEGVTTVAAYIVAFGSLLGVHVFVVYGGYQMYYLRNSRYARLAMALCVCPFVSPVYLLGMPGGIWAHVVLLKPNVTDAFEI